MSEPIDWNTVDIRIQEVINGQQDKLLRLGRQTVATLTSEDVLQPNDYPDLEDNPQFRYEEGLLAGLQSAQMALRALAFERD